MQLFGTSGIRRLADRNLVELSLQVGLAMGTLYDNVVVGRDTRTSGPALHHAVTSGLLATGSTCYDCGILPTPSVAFIVREFQAGIMITASHNPPQYNGLKLLNPDGSAFSAAQQKQVEDLIGGLTPVKAQWDQMQPGEFYNTAIEKHVSRISQDFPDGIKVKVVVDCGCGAAYFITPNLLKSLGCTVIPLNCYPSGVFPREVEPIRDNLGELMQAVKDSGADLGIAHDGDADRMMAVDDKGRFIAGDKMLAILACDSGSKDIVTTFDASLNIEEMGLRVRRTRVGDPYVSEELKKGGGFGGETSGAWVFPQISLCPDGIYAAARIARVAGRQRLSDLVDSIPSYPLVRGSISGNEAEVERAKDRLLEQLKPASVDTLDGLKLNFKDGWLLIRPSGTEPKIRITAEARSEVAARRYYESTIKIIEGIL
jgi:phosphoglucosamine mutase